MWKEGICLGKSQERIGKENEKIKNGISGVEKEMGREK